MFQLFKKKTNDFFSETEKEIIASAIKAAERSTSGEVRVFIESKCRFMNALDRAAEVFVELNMQQTMQRNGVLLYIAMKDRQLAVFGDEGIHQKVGIEFWNSSIKDMVQYFNKENYAQGIAEVVIKIGNALKQHFPYDEKGDTNELSDEVVFGR
jgi:uncharacterized membrane protein